MFKLYFDLFLYLLGFFVIALLFAYLKSPKVKGFFGEKTMIFYLSFLDKTQYHLINNVLLEKKDGTTTQIDHIVVSPYGLFVIETKNYNGYIYGKEFEQEWTQCLGRSKYKFHNPIKQNFGHIQTLKELLDLDVEHFHSIIAFDNKANLKVQTTTAVVYEHRLIREIKKRDRVVLSDEQVNLIVQTINENNIQNKENDRLHVDSLKQANAEKENKVAAGVCPRCGKSLVERTGKNGKFTGCSGFPKCRYVLK